MKNVVIAGYVRSPFTLARKGALIVVDNVVREGAILDKDGGDDVQGMRRFLALAASVVALWGVYLFNQRCDYTGARGVWFWSNTLFVIYFAGRCAALWDGGLGDAVMALYFARGDIIGHRVAEHMAHGAIFSKIGRAHV